jgi:purine-nucleoside phosphorylase
MQKTHVLHYENIPGFPRSTVHGHAGELVFGSMGGKQVICMRGRFHPYEGYDAQTTVIGIRVMAALGVKMIIITNAAGGVNKAFNIGDIMLMDDHISFVGMAGFHPLKGPNDDRFGPRFPSMSNAYDRDLIALARTVADRLPEESKPALVQGTYVAVSGPSYETPSEISMLRILGCDSVGMSTVLETTVARHAGIKVLGLSLITNTCLGKGEVGLEPCHQEVLDSIKMVQIKVESLVAGILQDVDVSSFPKPQAADYFTAERMV